MGEDLFRRRLFVCVVDGDDGLDSDVVVMVIM